MVSIGFLSTHNPFNCHSFSGTTFYMYKALCRLPQAKISVLAEKHHAYSGLRRLSHKITKRLRPRNFDQTNQLQDQDFENCLTLSQKDLKTKKFDFVIAPVASDLIYRLDTSNSPPIIFVTDAITKYIQENSYGIDISSDSEDWERASIKKSSKIVFSSHYMADKARLEYRDLLIDTPNKLEVIPFGLNLDFPPKVISHKKMTNGALHLLFVGRDWARKGGEVALDTLKEVQRLGIAAHLTIIGCSPESAKNQPGVTVIPYVNKSRRKEQKHYFDILNRSHMLLLPTRADCTPMVIAEANAFGIPALVSDIGGISTLVQSGSNGFLFPPSAGGIEYAKTIFQVFRDSAWYQKLSKTSRQEYENRLNWDVWAREICQIGKEIS